MVPAYVEKLDLPLETEKWGEIEGELLGTDSMAGITRVMPRVSGHAWIFGMQQSRLDPTDPFPQGFTLSDTWGPAP